MIYPTESTFPAFAASLGTATTRNREEVAAYRRRGVVFSVILIYEFVKVGHSRFFPVVGGSEKVGKVQTGTIMPRLQCRVSDSLFNEIKRIQIRDALNRGETLKYLIDLALNNVGHDVVNFGSHDSKDCYLGVDAAFYTQTQPYRQHYLLTKQTEFFQHALCLGASVDRAAKPPPPIPSSPPKTAKVAQSSS
jgi:hypothetical protein